MTTEKNAKDSAHLIVCIGTISRSCRPAASPSRRNAPVSSAGANRGDHGRVERYRSRGGPAPRPARWLAPRARRARPRQAPRRRGPAGRAAGHLRRHARCGCRGACTRRRRARGMRSPRAVRRSVSRGISLDEATVDDYRVGTRSELPRADPRVLAIWPQLVERNGRIVNVVSVAGSVPLERSTAYSCSKHAALAWSRALVSAAPLPRRHGDDREPGAGADARVSADGDSSVTASSRRCS